MGTHRHYRELHEEAGELHGGQNIGEQDDPGTTWACARGGPGSPHGGQAQGENSQAAGAGGWFRGKGLESNVTTSLGLWAGPVEGESGGQLQAGPGAR